MPYFRITLTATRLDGTIFPLTVLPVRDSELYTAEDVQRTAITFIEQECYTLQELTIDVIDVAIPHYAKSLTELLPITGQWPQYQIFLMVNNDKPRQEFMSLYQLEKRLSNLGEQDAVTIRFGLCRLDDFGKITAVSGQDRINIDALLGRLHLPASEFSEWR